jgi:hypothetical protein
MTRPRHSLRIEVGQWGIILVDHLPLITPAGCETTSLCDAPSAAMRCNGSGTTLVGYFTAAVPFGGYKFERDGARLLDARTLFHYGAIVVTPAMEAKMVGVGSQYLAESILAPDPCL